MIRFQGYERPRPVLRRCRTAAATLCLMAALGIVGVTYPANGAGSLPELPTRQAAVSTYGEAGWQRMQQWPTLVERLRGQPIEVQLAGVNAFFNQLRFVDDVDVWHVEDYWATPLEFLGVGAGDCEDFAMAKYLTLIELGVADETLRLHYVKYIPFDQFHMVVTWTSSPGAQPLVLDNIVKSIEPASARNDLTPIYSFNTSHLWISKLGDTGRQVGDASRLSLWQDWQRRLEAKTLRDPRD
ncbi:transglutaminase-like cysteine peptidase [Salinicola halophilus]|uniref:transglutaminase-like cysteine peptidase n=1 Tax=Salinicola halophilus TaxID=184065 RepID=UPI00195518B5|nr:transglutaminase-like cysteine peptidase [Salinicola halophilus]